MTEKRTAEDFLKEEIEKQWRERTSAFSSDPDSLARIPYIIHPSIHKIMNEYAAQECDKARNQAIQDCIDALNNTTGDQNVIPILEALKTII